jgi:hypothetical protein
MLESKNSEYNMKSTFGPVEERYNMRSEARSEEERY